MFMLIETCKCGIGVLELFTLSMFMVKVNSQNRGRGRGRGRAGNGQLVLEPGWVRTQDAPRPTIQNFTEPTGPTDRLPPNSEVAAFFDQMFGDDFFCRLAESTNTNRDQGLI